MRQPFTTRHYFLIVSATLLAAFLMAVVGLHVRAWYGGNYGSSIEFCGNPGHEAYGLIGFDVNVFAGGALGCLLTIAMICVRQ